MNTRPHTLPAIAVRYAGPTDTRGSRYIASHDGKRVTVPYDYSLDAAGNAVRAAHALATRLGWIGGHGAHVGSTGRGFVVMLTGDDSRAW